MNNLIEINGRPIGSGEPAYIIAEMSANHNQDFDQAVRIIQAAKEAGADAIKLQTYTPDTLTIDSDKSYFQIKKGTIWEGNTLYHLYGQAYTPWEWQPKLKAVANDLGLDLFSTPFDATSVDFLEAMKVPAYKIASFEVVDLALLQYIAEKGKPVIMSSGMATLAEIDEAVQTIRRTGNYQIALLKCNSAYPAPPEEMNLRTIPNLVETFQVPVGLSDHTLGIEIPIAAVALGACILEKHFVLSREVVGPDSIFSLEPHEFKAMVNAVRATERAMGHVYYGVSEHEASSKIFRRSLFVVENMKSGELFNNNNVRSIRPAYGLPPKHLPDVLGRQAACDIERGTPLEWGMVAGRTLNQ